MTGFKTRVLTRLEELAEIEGEWRDLSQRSSATVFQRPEWLLPWAETFCPSHPCTIEIRCGSGLVGLAPLLVYMRSEEQVLAFMGGGVSDYLDALVDPACEREAMLAIFEQMDELGTWTTLDLTDLPPDSPLRRTELQSEAAPHEHCSVLTLPQSREELLGMLSKHQRANLRNARARLQRAGGGTVEVAGSERDACKFLDQLFRLHTNRWCAAGEPGVLADENIRLFHQRAAPNLFAHGLLKLYRLQVSGRTIAVLYTLRSQASTYAYLQGFDPEFAFLSPGTQILFSVMEDSIRSGVQTFDFLRGEEAYKRHWRGQVQCTSRIQVPHSKLNCVCRSLDVAALTGDVTA
jgi:CelD/BcsL family acetyltransferase involved in cellulose biosynthesis